MVILHTETLKNWGGQQNRVLTELIGLSKKNYKVILACNRRTPLAQRAKDAGIKVYELNMVKKAHLQNIPKLINIIKNEKIDLIITHSSIDSWAGGISSKLTRRHLIRFRHNLFPVGKDPLTRYIYSIPNKIIAISTAVKDALEKGGLKSKKISVIPSSIDTGRFNSDVEDIRKETGIPADAVVIGNTSTFADFKGQEFFLQAFNIIHKKIPCYLLFAGSVEEPFTSMYLSYVNKELRNKVVLLDHRDDIPRVLKTIDIFVYPSFFEGLGTALLEAMAAEKSVVVSDIATFRDFIDDNINGLFFNAKNIEDLAEKVIYLIQDKSLQKQLGINARETIFKKFTIDKMIGDTEALYKEVLNAR